MMKRTKLIKAYTGTELTTMLLKGELERAGIGSVIQNDFQAGVTAGFGGGVPSAVDLYITESDRSSASPIIEQFLLANGKS